ncbi:glycosyl hydrolase family 88 [Streptomyces piniterrae]|uniref:Glycosyl hydrolase family 88 n=1 Tax=Streptomyces piniterrae TaxID=2571125 RepID=A0A4U0NR98_9ACTN|nr:glycoside hydrolase family 88 protein [Streptomyces piniterrae]TJZ57017.1 glycosyl hydrolase family 88 [Streptomyces piniterrae]
MERRHILAIGAALAAGTALPVRTAGAATGPRPSHRPPDRAEIVAVLRRVADHWIGAHSDPGDNQWARATFFSGLMALYRLTREPRYLAYTRGWAEKHGYGLHNGVTTRHADDHCAGQVHLDLYALDTSPDQAKIAAIEDSLQRMVQSSAEKHDDWWWADALHMAMPPFARLGALRDDPAYGDAMHALYTHTKNAEGGPGLHDPDTGLWYRDKRFLPGGIASPSGKPVLWSRGNGWAAAAHAKVLAVADNSHVDDSHAPECRATLVRQLAALRAVQRSDGFWNVNLADPDHLPGPETSGTAFFTYGTAYALRAGLVPREVFRPVAARAWNAMVDTALHPDGFLGYVQNVGDRPESSQPVTYDSTADFGVGAFLLAGTELCAALRLGRF